VDFSKSSQGGQRNNSHPSSVIPFWDRAREKARTGGRGTLPVPIFLSLLIPGVFQPNPRMSVGERL
jgi:hypothetical protein